MSYQFGFSPPNIVRQTQQQVCQQPKVIVRYNKGLNQPNSWNMMKMKTLQIGPRMGLGVDKFMFCVVNVGPLGVHVVHLHFNFPYSHTAGYSKN